MHKPQQPTSPIVSTPPATSPWLLPASIVLAALLVTGGLVYSTHRRTTPTTPTAGDTGAQQAVAPAPAERDVILGDPKAPVSIIEYADFQCPFCGSFFTDTVLQLRESYIKTGKAKMVYRSFSFLGPESTAAAEAAECAKDQQRFWEYHDAIYTAEVADGKENNGNLNRALFLKLATTLKLDLPAFTKCIDTHQYKDVVAQSLEDARQYAVASTPTIFVNDKKLEGALPTEQFEQLIDAELAR